MERLDPSLALERNGNTAGHLACQALRNAINQHFATKLFTADRNVNCGAKPVNDWPT